MQLHERPVILGIQAQLVPTQLQRNTTKALSDWVKASVSLPFFPSVHAKVSERQAYVGVYKIFGK
jgi:hypothetical protein